MKRASLFLFFFIFICFLTSRVFAVDQVDINTATLTQLDGLTGIGPKYAQAIIDARPFSSVNDLVRVKGIGPKTLQKIKDQGVACVNCQTEITQTQNTDAASSTIVAPIVSQITYPSGVYINEILPNPAGPDEQEEWIELYNSNNTDVDLSGWQIQDAQGTITTFTIPANTKILANGFLIFKRPETKIMLNNDQDGLNLLMPDTKIEDSMIFTSAPLGQSYNKTDSVWKWSTTLTSGSENIITAAVKVLPKAKNSVKNNVKEAGLADLNQTINPEKNPSDFNGASPWFLFFTALAATVILASIVLFVRIRFKNLKI